MPVSFLKDLKENIEVIPVHDPLKQTRTFISILRVAESMTLETSRLDFLKVLPNVIFLNVSFFVACNIDGTSPSK